MQPIKLTDVENSELEFLKNKLFAYFKFKEAALLCEEKNDINVLANEMLLIDLSRSLYFAFGTKIVSNFHRKKTPFTNLNLKISDAVILLASLNFKSTNTLHGEFENYTTSKYTGILHKALHNILI